MLFYEWKLYYNNNDEVCVKVEINMCKKKNVIE